MNKDNRVINKNILLKGVVNTYSNSDVLLHTVDNTCIVKNSGPREHQKNTNTHTHKSETIKNFHNYIINFHVLFIPKLNL